MKEHDHPSFLGPHDNDPVQLGEILGEIQRKPELLQQTDESRKLRALETDVTHEIRDLSERRMELITQMGEGNGTPEERQELTAITEELLQAQADAVGLGVSPTGNPDNR